MSEISVNIEESSVPIVNVSVEETSISTVGVDVNEKTAPLVEVIIDENSAQAARDAADDAKDAAESLDLTDLENRVSDLENPDAVLRTGEIGLIDLNLTVMPSAFAWRLNHVEFLTPGYYSTTLATATNGYYRYDLLQGTSAGTYSIKSTIEAESVAVPPKADDGCIALAAILVLGDSIVGTPEYPVIGAEYISKESKGFIRMFESGSVDLISINERSYLRFEEGMISLKSLNVPNSNHFYFGKKYTIKNGTAVNVTLFHNQGSGAFKFNFPNSLDLILKPSESVEFVIREINSTNNGGILDYVGLDYGKEDSVNKSNNVIDADSNEKFPVWSAITLWIKEKLNAALSAKTTLVDTDVLFLGDNSDSGKTKKILISNFIIWLKILFQARDTKFYIGSSVNVQNTWSGCTVFFTSSCTITVPSTLNAVFEEFAWRTMPGVTVTWQITSPFVWETTPITTPEKSDGLFTRYNGGNTIINRW